MKLRNLCALVVSMTFLSDADASAQSFSTKRSKDLGTYVMATGEWIRPDEDIQPMAAAVSLYDNTCIPGGGTVLAVDFTDPTETFVDTGQIPGPANTAVAASSAVSERYRVTGWRWSICPSEPNVSGGPGPLTANIFWFDCLDSCLIGGSSAALPPTQAISVSGIPGGGNSNVCYLFNVDLTGTTLEFELTGDCDGVFDGPGLGASGDTFGFAINVIRTDGMPMTGGVAIGLGGDPGTQTVGFGCRNANDTNGPAGFIGESTMFLNPTRHVDSSTGLGNTDDFIDAIGGVIPGCFSFGYFVGLAQTPYVGIHHELYGFPIQITNFTEYCNGDGGDQGACTPCPCGNDAPAGTVGGCVNGAGNSAHLVGSGIASVMNDTLRFEMSGGNPQTFAVLTSGSAPAPANPANPCFGLDSGLSSVLLDGLRCAVQGVQRHGARPMDANGDVGVTTNGWGPPNGPAGGILGSAGFVAGEDRFFQVIYREDAALVCGTGQNTSNGVSLTVVP